MPNAASYPYGSESRSGFGVVKMRLGLATALRLKFSKLPNSRRLYSNYGHFRHQYLPRVPQIVRNFASENCKSKLLYIDDSMALFKPTL